MLEYWVYATPKKGKTTQERTLEERKKMPQSWG